MQRLVDGPFQQQQQGRMELGAEAVLVARGALADRNSLADVDGAPGSFLTLVHHGASVCVGDSDPVQSIYSVHEPGPRPRLLPFPECFANVRLDISRLRIRQRVDDRLPVALVRVGCTHSAWPFPNLYGSTA